MYSALALTIFIESLVVYIISSKSLGTIVKVLIAVEFVTHPISMYAFHYLGWSLLLVESIVILVEAGIYWLYWNGKGIREFIFWLCLSFTANVASVLVAIVLL